MPNIALPLLVFAASISGTESARLPAPGQAAPAAKLNPLDKIVCRTEEGSGGRLHRQRVCATVRDWQDQAQDNREAAELLQRQGQNLPH